MVNAINCDIKNFAQNVYGKRIFCFGSGKYFRKFVSINPEIQICGVVDNYRQEKVVDIETREYSIYSIQEFCDLYREDCIMLITVRGFEEVVDQLDEIEELDGMPCFFPAVFDERFGISDDSRAIMIEQIRELSERICSDKQIASEEITGRKGYQICEYFERSNIGGSKARTDIIRILEKEGYLIKKIRCYGEKSGILQRKQEKFEWERVFEEVEENSIIVMQHPVPAEPELPEELFLHMKSERGIRFIIVVHEVESLRKTYHSAYRQHEFEVMLSIGDVFIVHNEIMRRFFVKQGIEEQRVVSLEIFDYLDSSINAEKKFEKSVTIAANLDLKKSSYLLHLKELNSLLIHLYGPNYDENIANNVLNIQYHGSLPSEVIPQRLDRGFGLIWDGDSIETCAGGTGEYLKYNNPHKLSLYLSAGLPVIIWRQAAQARFVLENSVGFCVDSLHDISYKLDEVTEEEYKQYVQNVEALSQKLKDGEYFTTALKNAEEILCPKYQ